MNQTMSSMFTSQLLSQCQTIQDRYTCTKTLLTMNNTNTCNPKKQDVMTMISSSHIMRKDPSLKEIRVVLAPSYFLPRNCPIRASHRPHLCNVTPLYLELPRENPVLWRRSMCTNSSLVKFFICWAMKEKKAYLIRSSPVRKNKNQNLNWDIASTTNLLKIFIIITDIKIDVCIQPTKFNCSTIICPRVRIRGFTKLN